MDFMEYILGMFEGEDYGTCKFTDCIITAVRPSMSN